MRAKTFQGHSAIGYPDALPIEIHLAGCRATGCFLRSSAGEERPMKHRQFRMPGWIWNCEWEETGIFVIHVAQFDALPMRVGCETETLPVKENFL
jgi:hypothetical protein